MNVGSAPPERVNHDDVDELDDGSVLAHPFKVFEVNLFFGGLNFELVEFVAVIDRARTLGDQVFHDLGQFHLARGAVVFFDRQLKRRFADDDRLN